MRRREFITLLGGATAAWPLAARAQQPDQVRRVAVLMGYSEADLEAKELLREFKEGLSELGWIEGRNLLMVVRWAPGRTDLMRTFAKELVGLQPDVILADSTPVTAALKHETFRIPIVFAAVAPPRRVMNSRLLIRSPRRRSRVDLAGHRCRALWRS